MRRARATLLATLAIFGQQRQQQPIEYFNCFAIVVVVVVALQQEATVFGHGLRLDWAVTRSTVPCCQIVSTMTESACVRVCVHWVGAAIF